MMSMRKLSGLGLLALVMTFLLAPMALGQEGTVRVRANWGAPDPGEGSAPVLYRLEIRFRANEEAPVGFWGEIATTTAKEYVLTFNKGMCYEVRVRAEDAAGVRGPYSQVSAEFCVPPENGDLGNNLGPLPPENLTGPIKQGD